MWLFAVVAVAVMGVTAMVATGRGGGMAEVFDDRVDSRVPADRPLRASDLARVRFSTALRGYRMSEVDALLDRLAEQLEPPAEAGAAAPAEPPAHPPADGSADPPPDPE